MCGISGLWSPRSNEMLEPVALSMAKAIESRGPDDFGSWSDREAGVALGHRRLAIVDLSAAGHQPMASASDRYVMAFNGEIYNHLELRALLADAGAAPAWRGHSDTETLLAAFEHWGLESTLQRAVGMFAIALWDSREQTLSLARDRFGEKPLYYGWVGDAFAFGSELKALRACPGFANAVCREALAQYFRFMYVPAPRSIYRDIYKLEPGCLLSITGAPQLAPAHPLRPGETDGFLAVRRWWSLADTVEASAQSRLTDEAEALGLLETALSQAVQAQSLADVPLGAFLSGGVDSSTIVALMQKQSSRPVKTFTIGFEEAGFDESPHAKAVAMHLGTDHQALFVTAHEAQAVVPALPHMYDEPFADSSQIPTYLVCKAARRHVTVALSGDAGDELLGGYNRYVWGPRIWSRLSWMPLQARQSLGYLMSSVPGIAWDALGKPVNVLRKGTGGVNRLGDKAHKLARTLRTVRDVDSLYLSLVSEWQDPAALVKPENGVLKEPTSLLGDPLPDACKDEDAHRMMFRDSMTYLPDDILCKVDRAAMANSLETRVPFLDHRVAELAWRLPLNMKIRGNEGKWALRQVLYKYVPRELIERPKAGFAIPVGQWLRGPLREWAEDLLNPVRMAREGFLHVEPVEARWREHVSGERDYTSSLWAVLMFQAWLRGQDKGAHAC